MAARRNKTGAQVNIPMCLACVLLCLTLFSIHFSSGVVARYTTTTNSGDSARVIKFGNLTLTETGTQRHIAPGVALEWNVLVSFKGSESATYVFVEVSEVPVSGSTVTLFDGGPSWTVADGWNSLDPVKYPGVYYRALSPNKPLDNVALFKKNESTAVSEGLTAEQITAIGNIEPVFRGSVVQSNGFDSPAAAWNSLETNH